MFIYVLDMCLASSMSCQKGGGDQTTFTKGSMFRKEQNIQDSLHVDRLQI